MRTNHPNRIRTQIAGFDNILQKKSGDQHLQPEDDTLDAPHRPHRVNREDTQKTGVAGSGPDSDVNGDVDVERAAPG